VNKLKIRSFVVNSIICPKAEKLNIEPRKTHLYNITNIQCTNLKKLGLFTLPLNGIRDVLSGPTFTSRRTGMDLVGEAGENGQKSTLTQGFEKCPWRKLHKRSNGINIPVKVYLNHGPQEPEIYTANILGVSNMIR
jgi:hypothetical protein